MLIETCFGTILVFDRERNEIQHVLPRAMGGLTPIRIERPRRQGGDAETINVALISGGVLSGHSLHMLAEGSQFHVSNGSAFLSADPGTWRAMFDRDAANLWETFSFVEEDTVWRDAPTRFMAVCMRALQEERHQDALTLLEQLMMFYPDNDFARFHLQNIRNRQRRIRRPPVFVSRLDMSQMHETSWIEYLLDGSIGAWRGDFNELDRLSTIVIVDNILDEGSETLYKSMFFAGFRTILIHLSDEHYVDDLSSYRWCSSVWRNYWSLTTTHMRHVDYFPLGYKAEFTSSPDTVGPASSRPSVWSFAGDPNKSSRGRMLACLHDIDGGETHLTSGFGSGDSLDTRSYRAMLDRSVFAPCPAGNTNLETFRIYEALEAGCIPIVESPSDSRYFLNLLGDHPLPMVSTWEEGRSLIRQMRETHAEDRLQYDCRAWWKAKKLALKSLFVRDVYRL